MKVLFSAICLFFLLQLQAQTTQPPTGWKSHRDSAYGFTFIYPTDWDLKLPGTNTRFFLTSKLENDSDQFRENINCIARGLQQKDFKISDATEEIKKSLSENLKDYHLIRSGYSNWNNSQLFTIEYTCTQESNGKKYSIHLLQHIAVVKSILFTITYTADVASFSKYESTVDKVFKSLKI
jgi:hypothetical protein